MREENLGNNIKVRYYSNCTRSNQVRVETSKCENINVDEVVEFVVSIRLIECPINPNDWKRQFYIYPVGSNKNLTVDVDMICDCPCQYSGHRVSVLVNFTLK